MSLPTPNTRKEQYLNAIATGNSGGLPTPITREEEYLNAIAKSGGGSGDGDMKKSVYDSDLGVANAGGIGAFVSDAISGKVDKVEGKGLSENDYTDADKAIVGGVTDALAGKVDKVEGKGLSTNDYDNTEKGKVADNTGAIEAIVNEYGAKNLLPNTATSQTIADGTITVNSDGSIRTNIATTNGVVYDITDYFTVPTGDYILSKGMSLGQSQVWLQFFNGSTFVKDIKLEGEASKLVTIDYDGYTQLKCVGYIPPSTTIDTTVYPMIRDARIKDTTYAPYAMTNRELTESIVKKIDAQTIVMNGSTSHSVTLTFSGKAVCRTPHYVIFVSGQSGVSSPVVLSFAGADIYDAPIAGILLSPEAVDAGITVNDLSVTIPNTTGGGWGVDLLLNLIPDDNPTYTVAYA